MNRIPSASIRIVALTMLTLLPLTARASTPLSSVRIGLTQYGSSIKQITVSSLFGRTVLASGSTKTAYRGPVVLEAGTTGIACKVDSMALNADSVVRLTPEDPSAYLVVSCPGRSAGQYRGSIETDFDSGVIRLINELPVDDYLKGVLPAEIGSSAPEAALKAQAIVARNYTLTNTSKHSSLGYDLCDNTHCQQYNGVLSESNRCTKAIIDTAGQVLTYGDHLAEVFYSSDCGGVTQSYEEAYKKPAYPYLAAVPDPCELNHQSWKLSLKLTEIESLLTKAGVKADGLQSIKVSELGPSGRVQSMEIAGKLGTTKITGSKFRLAVSKDEIKSTLFAMESGEDGSVVIKGKGWGHGIGLCQVGAMQLAKAPHEYSCNRILSHYFPGTRISLYGSAGSATQLASGTPSADPTAQLPALRSTKSVSVESAPHPQQPDRQQSSRQFEVRVKAPDSL